MANIKSAKKRARQSEAARKHNLTLRSQLRSSIKKVKTALDTKDPHAKEIYQSTVPIIDKMVNKGIIRKNTAARYKSRLNARLKKISLSKTI